MLNWRFIAVVAMVATDMVAATQAQSSRKPQSPVSLKDAYRNAFLIGVAINSPQIKGQDMGGDAIVERQFNSITPENVLKWEVVHPEPDVYNFDLSDQNVSFGEKRHMFVVGHCLVWHSQTPAWVFRDDKGDSLDRDALLKRMHDHIQTVVGRYKGRIQAWDVVNEALNENGTMRQSPWQKIIGDDYVEKAFQYAHEADPQAKLVYNDYNLENDQKRKGALVLITKLKAEGVPVDAVGLQGHDSMDWPSLEDEDTTIGAFASLGVKVIISELDIDLLPPATEHATADVSVHVEQDPKLNPYPKGLPESVQKELGKRYSDLFKVFLKHRGAVIRVTFWGLSDGDSWRNDWPVLGRTSYPLLFDRSDQPKLAFHAVLEAAGGKN
jgi:endo-1,4-beta-xylanase